VPDEDRYIRTLEQRQELQRFRVIDRTQVQTRRRLGVVGQQPSQGEGVPLDELADPVTDGLEGVIARRQPVGADVESTAAGRQRQSVVHVDQLGRAPCWL